MRSNLIKVGVLASAALAPFASFAEVVYTSQSGTTTALVGAITADLSTVLLYVVSAVIALAVVLVGIGYGWRKLKSKVFGKAF